MAITLQPSPGGMIHSTPRATPGRPRTPRRPEGGASTRGVAVGPASAGASCLVVPDLRDEAGAARGGPGALRRRGALLLGAAALLTLGACEALTGPSELERSIAKEQEVIAAYSEHVPKVDALQREFASVWREAHELKDVRDYRDALESRVVPALTAYVEAARAMPTGSDELRAIHEVLVGAYEEAHAAFKVFAEEVDHDTIEEGYQKVLDSMDGVKRAEVEYLDRLKSYYARHRVDLVLTPPAERQP